MRNLLCCLAILLSWPASAVVTPLPGTSGQHNYVFVSFPNPIGVRVTTAAGAAAPGAEVTFTVTNGITLPSGRTAPLGRIEGPLRESPACPDTGTSTLVCVVAADSNGVAVLPPAYATVAGRYRILASARFGSEVSATSFELVGDPQFKPFTMLLSETARVITSLIREPLIVSITKPNGFPASDSEVLVCGDARFAVFDTPAAQACYAARTDRAGTFVTPALRPVSASGEVTLYVRAYDEFAATYVEAETKVSIVANGADIAPFIPQQQALWWGGPSQSGWGLSIMQHDQRFFMVLFAYDAGGRATWFVAPDGHWRAGVGSTIDAQVYRANGSAYYDYDASKFRLSDPYLGTGYQPTRTSPPEQFQVHYLAPGRSVFEGDFILRGYTTDFLSIPITPQQFAGTSASPLTGLGDMWWGGPSQAGWGIAIHEQFGALFSVWFTYDEFGYPIWFVLQPGAWVNGNTYAGEVYQTQSSAFGFLGQTYNANLLRTSRVGTYRFVFSDRNNAVLQYDVDGHAGSYAITRQPF